MWSPLPADDESHDALPIEAERWQFDAWCPATGMGLWVEFGWEAAQRSAWYLAVLAPLSGPVIVVVDGDIALPRLTRYLEFRAEGIWAQHVCEDRLEHWTLGLEAFGVELDDPQEAAGRAWGNRTAVGLDVEFYASDSPLGDPDGAGFSQAGRLEGEVLIDERTLLFEGAGARQRRWGSVDALARPAVGESPTSAIAQEIPVLIQRPSQALIVQLSLLADGRWNDRR